MARCWREDIPAGHDNGETARSYGGGQNMNIPQVSKDEGQLVHRTAVANSVGSQLSQAQLGQQLFHKDDKANG